MPMENFYYTTNHEKTACLCFLPLGVLSLDAVPLEPLLFGVDGFGEGLRPSK